MAVPETVASEQFALGLSLEEFKDFAERHDGAWELEDGVPVKMQSPSVDFRTDYNGFYTISERPQMYWAG